MNSVQITAEKDMTYTNRDSTKVRKRIQQDDKNRFTLALHPGCENFLNADKRWSGTSKTGYINSVLRLLSATDSVFGGTSKLEELKIYVNLSHNPLMKRLKVSATAARRTPLQQLLFLLEKSLHLDEKARRQKKRCVKSE